MILPGAPAAPATRLLTWPALFYGGELAASARADAPARAAARLEVPVSEGSRPGEDGPEELYAAFAALGGPHNRDEFMRVPLDKIMPFAGSSQARSALVRLAALLLGGDTPAA